MYGSSVHLFLFPVPAGLNFWVWQFLSTLIFSLFLSGRKCKLKLWTIPPLEVHTCIQNTGSYRCLPEKSPNLLWSSFFLPDFQAAYGWLNEKMKARIGAPPEGISYPVWAWHTYDKKRKKLDLRHGGYKVKGSECVCMEIEIPDSDVVLSDFNAWHFVLNHMYLNPDCFSGDTFDQDQRWLDSMTAEEREKAIRSSWDAIFDIRYYENDWVAWGSLH